MKFDVIPTINEEHSSLTYGCNRFIESCSFSSDSSVSLLKYFVDNSHIALKKLKKNAEKDEFFHLINEKEEEDRTIEDSKKDYPDKTEKLEETLVTYISEDDPKKLKTDFPDKSKYLNQKGLFLMNNSRLLMIFKNRLVICKKRLLQKIEK